MSNYNQSLIEDYRQTIERLQKECTEKTNAIIALGERLKAKTQECEQIKEKYEALKLENQEGYEIVAELKHECEELKEDYAELEQECEKVSILAQEESARNGYVEYELNEKLKEKTQE